MRSFVPEGQDARSYRWPALGVIGLALLASVTSLTNGFAYDDRWIIVENDTVHNVGHWWGVFGDTYWPMIRNAALYRPLTILAFVFQWAAGGGTPLIFHTLNVILYAAVAVLVYALALQILPRRAAWVAAALFAVHPVHVEAVGNVVGQAELWAAAALIGGVAVYLAARRDGRPLDRETRFVICGIYFVGMMFKENAIVLPALLVAAEAFVVRDTRGWKPRADALVSLLVWMTALAMIYLWVRVAITGELGGDVEHPALRNLGAVQRAWVMLGLAPEFARLLLWPARLYADYSPQLVQAVPSPSLYHLNGALLILCLTALAIVAARRFPLVTFALAWIAIAISPVANILLPTGILLAERTLLVPSVSVVIAVAALVPWFEARLAGRPRAARLAAAGGLAIVLMLGAARSADRQRTWHDTRTVFSTLIADAPFSFKAHYANGGTLWEAKRPGEAEREWRYAIALYPEYFAVYQDLAHKYREAHVCPAAIPLYIKSLAIEPALPFARLGLAACYLEIAHYREARSTARIAIAWGDYRKAFEFVIGRADSALVANDTLDGANRWAGRSKVTVRPKPSAPKPPRTNGSQNAISVATPGSGEPRSRRNDRHISLHGND
ncbi:MAG TPA: tetratricopeptide repeat protein [Gemmatimonadaceae bacterium]|nr:tetratricopeptide repeat protein [Gemmatimonadaceae bacterium]